MTPLLRQQLEDLFKSNYYPFNDLPQGNNSYLPPYSGLYSSFPPSTPQQTHNSWPTQSLPENIVIGNPFASLTPLFEPKKVAIPENPVVAPSSATLEFRRAFTNDKHPKLWEGDLQQRDYSSGSGIFSKKIFIGGLPRDMTDDDILYIFGKFDPDVRIEWPDNRRTYRNSPKGYLYIIFQTNTKVRNLLFNCNLVIEGGCETFNFPITYKGREKVLQVIPWLTSAPSDSYFHFSEPTELQRNKYTVFVGALHGRLHAKAIAHIFNTMFGNVMSVTIDTDRHNYPTGSGRITFSCRESYTRAIVANYVQIDAKKLSKKVQIEPCIDGQKCCLCKVEEAQNFCKEDPCFREEEPFFDYFCNDCWEQHHFKIGMLGHKPIRRKNRFEL